tara:strand:- start:10906 stop:11442 length:537 start_codon:yes stop_codon:yes gene_type:complete
MNKHKEDKYNGRVNIMEPPDTKELFKIYDRIPANQPVTFRDATKGVLLPSKLSTAFFSAQNMEIIQNGIRKGIYQKTNEKTIIPNQNVDTLMIIMRSIYLQHAINRPDKIKEQIDELNKLVYDYAVPNVYSSLVSYQKYLEDASTLPSPMEKPKDTYNYKELPMMNYGFTKDKPCNKP